MTIIARTDVNSTQLLIGIDPQIDSWPLMGSPLPVMLILSSYLLFVLKVGPEIMSKRTPFQLNSFLVVYNAYQMLFSLWFFSQAFVDKLFYYVFSFGCRSVKDENPELMMEILRCAWWYFFSKVIDLLDTVFFVLRKKQNQVSFLHVYHHSMTCFFSWCYLKYMPGEQGVVIGTLNAFVHIIMYFYYMVSAMGPKYQKYLWWKKYMTWIQLTQFALMLIYLTLVAIFNCKKFHKILTYFFFINVAFLMYLFASFYRKTYRKTFNSNNNNNNNNNTSNLNKNIDENAEVDEQKLHQVNGNGTFKMHKTN